MKKNLVLALLGGACVFVCVFGARHPQALMRAVDHAVPPGLNASLGRHLQLSQAAEANEPSDDGSAAPALQASATYDLSAHQTLSHVIVLIRDNYVEPDRIRPYDMFLAALDYIQKTVPEVMVDDHLAPAHITVSCGHTSQQFELGSLEQLWEVAMALRDVFRFLQTGIVEPNRRRDIEYAAINGMLSTLDPHSILLSPENFDEVKLSTKGEFGGLGIVISIRDAALTIISPIEGTPAFAAGLKSRDKIVKIGEESTINMGLDEAVQKLRGRAGSKVVIWVGRKGWTEPKKFVLARAIIKIQSVTSELLQDAIGYIKIKSFQGNTYDDLQAHLGALKAKNNGAELRGLVLDLRNNPGGLLDQAILVSDRFIDRGALVITVGESNRKREVKQARASGDENLFPIAVLLNGGSASASEIVAGALKNHDRAVVIGQQSFGKGSVQVLYDFKDRSALKLTIAQYLTPGDISIQSVGVVPDVAIVPAVVDKEGIHMFVDDDSPREKDLQKHLEQHGVSALTHASVKILHLSPSDLGADVEASGSNAGAHSAPHEVDEAVSDAFTYDFDTQLAHDVLLRAQSQKRPAMIQQAMAYLREQAEAQDRVVAARFGELGIDWRAEPATAEPPPATVAQAVAAARPQGSAQAPTLEVGMATSAQVQPVSAGQMVTLTGSVRNTGSEPLHRVYGVSQSDNPFLKNLEFVFGTLEPGQRRQWEVRVKIPADIPMRADGVSLLVGDAHGMTGVQSRVALVRVSEQKLPTFALSYSIDDARSGNGDGVLQVGESIALQVRVHNLGPGVADDVTVSLKNLAGEALYLEEGRGKVGRLGVGEDKRVSLRLSLKAGLPSNVAKLRLGVYDATLGAQMAYGLALPVLPARRGKPATCSLRVAMARGVSVYAGADRAMPIVGTAKDGTVMRCAQDFGEWVRVQGIDRGAPGFVARRDVQVLPGAGAGIAMDRRRAGTGVDAGAPRGRGQTPLALAPPMAAPDIALDVPSLVASSDRLHVHGRLAGRRPMSDMFIFANDKKVYFRALNEVPAGADGFCTTFDVDLPVKVGSNNIAIIVREDEDLMSRKMFGVFRAAP